MQCLLVVHRVELDRVLTFFLVFLAFTTQLFGSKFNLETDRKCSNLSIETKRSERALPNDQERHPLGQKTNRVK